MRIVLQRVQRAEVRVRGRVVGRIGRGIVALVGIGRQDTREDGQAMAEKIANLRLFDDEHGRMSRSLLETAGGVLCVSEFTLYGDCQKGRRPSFDQAASPQDARPLYEAFVESLRALGIGVETGQFQAMMELDLVNDGPVALLLDSEKAF